MAASYLWQVALHSSIMGLIFYTWAYRVQLPSGATKRRLLAILLILPMITAAVPGRDRLEFGERIAWLNSARLLAVPLPGGFQLWHVAALIGVVAVLATIWQEVLASFRRPRAGGTAAPPSLVSLVGARPGWEACEVVVSPLTSIMLATTGRPGQPTMIVSRGAIDTLTPDELAAVIDHEHAHWRRGQWLRSHVLFAVRLLQCYNPVALWVFREYCIEVEIACDAAAVSGRDPHVLARVLLKIYRETDRRDLAARAALRKRVDVLLAGGIEDPALPTSTVAVASAVMLLVLPWIV